ncbi:uncharacterized protein LOC114272464 [Camellia sinensis]|uniref:uncharacterized protein LOC114272464 n=1 Tax=Camellia sinensis TaxID=4442 RepID=UPI0010368BBF|nr:uncharacterized protein LOC114272464 [Camellia sinensis]
MNQRTSFLKPSNIVTHFSYFSTKKQSFLRKIKNKYKKTLAIKHLSLPSLLDMSRDPSPFPIHLFFVLVILFILKSFSWYINYEYMFEGLFDHIKLVFIVSPLILLLVMRVLSNFGTGPWRWSLDMAGGTPWRVGFILVLLFSVISYQSSYQSSFQETWSPLLISLGLQIMNAKRRLSRRSS